MKRASRRRSYDLTNRREAADRTVRSIIEAARLAFIEQGYAATTMPAIAKRAGVSLDTVYASIGKKPTLFRLLVESAISGSGHPVEAEQRDYVIAIRAESTAAGKLGIYAAALARIHTRLAPLLRVLQVAAPLDADLESLWREIAERRSTNMRTFAENLLATGQIRAGLSAERIADVIWSMGSTEFYLLLVDERNWTVEAFERWLGESWAALLLASPAQDGASDPPSR